MGGVLGGVSALPACSGTGAGAVTGPIRAFQTLASVTPVTGRPLAFWYALTRDSVIRP